jgi:hypothetical protein
MLEHDPVARRLIAAALGDVVDRTVREHVAGITQEPDLTAHISQALENKLDGPLISGYHVRIVAQVIPSDGPGALESLIGADLYVGIEVREGDEQDTKGFLVQAKLKRNLDSAGRQKLRNDCRKLLNRTEASFVWLYGPNGVRVLNAQRVRDSLENPLSLPARRTRTLFARTLECPEGDRALGLPDVRGRAQMRSALGTLLEGLRIAQAVAISIVRPSARRPSEHRRSRRRQAQASRHRSG